MNKIETYADLMVEKNRLEILLSIQKETILMDINQLKIEFQPTMDLLKFMSKITIKGKDNTLISASMNLISDFLLKNILLAKSGWIVRLVVPYLVKNYSSNTLAKEGTGLLPRLIAMITKIALPK
jgi:hypothetical protein